MKTTPSSSNPTRRRWVPSKAPPLAVLALLASPAVADDATAPLTVMVTYEGGSGPLYLSFFDSEDGYPRDASKARFKAKVRMTDGKGQHTLQVPVGDWGVAAWLDVDDDLEMDTNWLGVPNEPIGMVGPRPTLTSRTTWARNSVSVPAEGRTVPIEMFTIF